MKALALSAALVVTGPAAAQAPDTESAFEKSEFQNPMRDGVRLYTAVYAPRDDGARYPILLYRTRYGVGHYGAKDYAPLRDLAWPEFDGPPYIFVWQDVRGSFLSGGQFVDMTPHRPRNPQTFVDIYHATEADFRKATKRIYRSVDAASYVEIKRASLSVE